MKTSDGPLAKNIRKWPTICVTRKGKTISTGLRHAVVIYSRLFVDHSKYFELFLPYFLPFSPICWHDVSIVPLRGFCDFGGHVSAESVCKWISMAQHCSCETIFETIFICQSWKCSIERKSKGKRTNLREFFLDRAIFETVIAAGFWIAQQFVWMWVVMEFILLQKEQLGDRSIGLVLSAEFPLKLDVLKYNWMKKKRIQMVLLQICFVENIKQFHILLYTGKHGFINIVCLLITLFQFRYLTNSYYS